LSHIERDFAVDTPLEELTDMSFIIDSVAVINKDVINYSSIT